MAHADERRIKIGKYMTMLTTHEAAQILAVTQRRVRALIQSGALIAHKAGPLWLVDEESVRMHASTSNRQGGRPKRGSRSHEFVFTLYNRTHEIAELVYDDVSQTFISVGTIADSKRAPFGLISERNTFSLVEFNTWWRNRGIPQTRPHIEQVLHELGLHSVTELSVKNLGFSLSDQYWICPQGSDLTWENLNFFTNDFDDLSLTEQRTTDISSASFLRHPDNTSDGVLPKHWVTKGGRRLLLKAGMHNDQEPYNEVVATKLYDRLLSNNEYVTYELDVLNGAPASVCENFLTSEEEFIPAHYISKVIQQQSHHSEYQHYLECCNCIGAAGVSSFLDKMIICDDILSNSDRHWHNFGVIRNIETLECSPAPIFDSGSSLWHSKSEYDLKHNDYSYQSKQFKPDPSKQFLLAQDLSWLNIEALDGFVEEAVSILEANKKLSSRLPYIKEGLQQRVKRLKSIIAFI